MHKRYNLNHNADIRAKIGSIHLAKRLEKHANGELELSSTQIQAAKILLAKTIPDLSAITLSGDQENPIVHTLAQSDQEILNRYLTQKENK